MIPELEWEDPPKARIAELLVAVEERLRGAGLAGIREAVELATEVARGCPWGIGKVRLEVRVGRSDELVPLVAEETDADIIALGWAQELEPGRAPVVRAALARAGVPVLLVPVNVLAEPAGVGSAPVGALQR